MEKINETENIELGMCGSYFKDDILMYNYYGLEIPVMIMIRNIMLSLGVWKNDSYEVKCSKKFEYAMYDNLSASTDSIEFAIAGFYAALVALAKARAKHIGNVNGDANNADESVKSAVKEYYASLGKIANTKVEDKASNKSDTVIGIIEELVLRESRNVKEWFCTINCKGKNRKVLVHFSNKLAHEYGKFLAEGNAIAVEGEYVSKTTHIADENGKNGFTLNEEYLEVKDVLAASSNMQTSPISAFDRLFWFPFLR